MLCTDLPPVIDSQQPSEVGFRVKFAPLSIGETGVAGALELGKHGAASQKVMAASMSIVEAASFMLHHRSCSLPGNGENGQCAHVFSVLPANGGLWEIRAVMILSFFNILGTACDSLSCAGASRGERAGGGRCPA